MTHFCIEKGTIRSYNGTLAICSPLPFDITCNPKALPMVQAIKNCESSVALALTPSGKLSIKSGNFRASIECIEGETLHVMPEGKRVDFNGAALLAALTALEPFIGDD